MEAIRVKLRDATERGRLYPRYDEEADVLELSSTVPRDWPHGIDIDGRIIFDLDADRVLVNLDLLIPRRRWKITPSLEPPQASRSADLEIAEISLAHKSFHLPLEVTTNEPRSCARILFGKVEHQSSQVALSSRCLAFIEEDRLIGFFVRLE